MPNSVGGTRVHADDGLSAVPGDLFRSSSDIESALATVCITAYRRYDSLEAGRFHDIL
jgi:hypothetical protein